MGLESRDVIALALIIALSLLLYVDKVTLAVYTGFIGAIIGAYFGVQVGIILERRRRSKDVGEGAC